MSRKSKTNGYIAKALFPLVVSLHRIKPDPANVRKHPVRNLETIVASLQRYGQRKPIVVNKRTGLIEAGNATWEAAKRLGWEKLAAVFVDDDPTTATGYAVADNRTAELAEWDDVELVRTLEALQTAGEMTHVGFDDQELDALLRLVNPPKPETFNVVEALEAAPELAERVKLGQVWQLGRHRLMCGDATQAVHVEALLRGERPPLMVTDPPYGVDYDPAWRQEAAEQGHLAYAARRVGVVTNDDRVDWYDAWRLFPGDVVYCWHAGRHASVVQASLERAGFEIRYQIIWAKPHFPISRGHYHWRHEPYWYAVRQGAGANWVGGRAETTLREIALDPNAFGGHGTQKPVECMAFPIRNHLGDVYDPFIGSGTTIIAAEQHERQCYAMEIEPRYCAVAIARWESYTGQSAILDESCLQAVLQN